MSVETFTTRRRRSTTPSPRSPAGARPVAGGTDLVVGARQGKAPLPERIVAIHRIAELRGIDRGRRRPAPRCARHATREIVAHADDPRAVHGARRRVRDRRLPRDPRPRHDRRQRDERLARDGRPAARCCASARRRRSARRRGDALGPARRAVDRTGHDRRRAPTSCSSRSSCPRPPPGTGSCLRPARVPPPDGDRGRRRDRRRRRSTDGAVTDARVAITALAPTIRRVPDAEAALDRHRRRRRRGRGRRRRAAAEAATPDHRRPRLRPTTAARWPR